MVDAIISAALPEREHKLLACSRDGAVNARAYTANASRCRIAEIYGS